jgi:arsenate reductase
VSVCSAGAEPAATVHPDAVKVMQEMGVDISGQRPKPPGDIPWGDIDTVITLCAEQGCTLPPGGLVQHHWALEDPTTVAGSDEEQLNAFRRTREEVRWRLEELLEKSK